jgi:predicted ATP-binding protein involved in virulence
MSAAPVRLKQFKVDGLFGLFNHTIRFDPEKNITIIHAPNGYGKTIILQMISGFFGGSLSIFGTVEFRAVTFELSDGGVLSILQGAAEQDLVPSKRPQLPPGSYSEPYRFIYEKDGKRQEWNQFSPDARQLRQVLSPVMVDRYLPMVTYIGGGKFRDDDGNYMTFEETMERYLHFLPKQIQSRLPHAEWLEKLRKQIPCQLIRTQRLEAQDEKVDERLSRREPPPLVVQRYATTLAASIDQLLARSAVDSQRLDQSFPRRILARTGSSSGPQLPTVDRGKAASIRARLTELAKKRERLAAVDLLDATENEEMLEYTDNAITVGILEEYAKDTSEKLAIYDDLLARLELFTSILNARFSFKRVDIDRRSGFIIRDDRGVVLSPKMLSSGEQHEVVLLFDMLFKSDVGALILIDEPEISLHVTWQRRFLDDLERIIKLTGIEAVVATHSPQLISDRMDDAIVLCGPDDVD